MQPCQLTTGCRRGLAASLALLDLKNCCACTGDFFLGPLSEGKLLGRAAEGREGWQGFPQEVCWVLVECFSGRRSLAPGLEWSEAADRSARTPEELARAFCRQELGWSCAICLKCPHHYFYSPSWTPARARAGTQARLCMDVKKCKLSDLGGAALIYSSCGCLGHQCQGHSLIHNCGNAQNEEKITSSSARGGLDGTLEKILHLKSVQALAQLLRVQSPSLEGFRSCVGVALWNRRQW